jgi:chemosensory pili system protein ChpA (sensor histidine kinase/response regulator)
MLIGASELLLGIFLMEAWDTAGALEEGLGLLSATTAPTEHALAPLVVFAHRLKGSAALHGFPGVSDLAAAAERLLEWAPAAPPEERRRAAGFLDGLVGLLKGVFDGISAVGVEDAARLGEFKARYPVFFSTAPAAPAAPRPLLPPAAPPAIRRRSRRSPWTCVGSSSRWRGPGVLPAQAAEPPRSDDDRAARDRGGARDEDTLATVFRAAHALKGAAYTVGCAPLGDATHQIEDVLVAVREHRLPVTPG